MNWFSDKINDLGDALEDGVDEAKELTGKLVDSGAHLVGDGLDAVGLHSAATAIDGFGDSVADYLGAEVAEQELDQTDDPKKLVHGDAEAITETARHLGKFAGAFEDTAVGLKAIDSSDWGGKAGDAFREKFDKHPQQWSDAHEACATAAGAWEIYGASVKWAQDQARQATELYRQGRTNSDNARSRYRQQVEAHNRDVGVYNAAVAAGQPPGPAPTPPGAFVDPGAAQIREAQAILEAARARRDSAADEATQAIRAATDLAPQQPSFTQRMLHDGEDLVHAAGMGSYHLLGGAIKGTADIARFVRSLDPADPYNLTHPAAYLDGLSATAAAMVHDATHPVELVKSLVGSGWGTDPFEAAGKLVPQVALAVGTDGAGTAADAAAGAGERGALEAAEDAAARKGIDEPRDPARDRACKECAGEPIDTATGSLLLDQVDVDLPGVLPLVIGRHHTTSYQAGRWFGTSWASVLDERVEIDDDGVVFTRGDGVILCYPHPVPGGVPPLPADGGRWPMAPAPHGGFTITDPGTGHVRHFDRGSGNVLPLSAITDRNGNRLLFHRRPDGTPTAVRHDGGYHVRVETTDRRITALHLVDAGDGGGEVTLVRYGYTDQQLTEVINSSGSALRFAYTPAGWITRWIDRNETAYHYSYDASGRCVKETGPDGVLEYHFEYTEADDSTGDRTTTVTNSLGAISSYRVNSALQVVAVTDPLDHTTRSTWDRYDRLLSRTDPLGRTTRYTYDELGRLVAVTHPDGTRALAEHNDLGLPTVVVEPDGAVWRQDYDDRGNLRAQTDPTGARTTFRFDEHGHLTTVTDPLGRARHVETNLAGLPVSITDPTGATTQYERDTAGRVVRVTDPVGSVTTFGWTVEGRPSWCERPGGTRETWFYDDEGNMIEHRDAAGAVTRLEYTHFDRPSARVAPDGARYEYEYDSELRLVAVTNPIGLSWRYVYDPAGRLASEADFNGRTLAYAYDPAGQLIERTNGAGEVTHFRRDLAGNLVEQRSASGTATFGYDEVGRLMRADNAAAHLRYERDAVGRVLAETVNDRIVTSTYDTAGRRIRRTTPSGAVSVWSYDAAGHPVALAAGTHTIRFDRDIAGREVRRHLDEVATLEQTWDAAHLLTSQVLVSRGGEDVLQRRSYSYREDRALVGIDDLLGGSRRLTLDVSGRVTSIESAQHRERYDYAANGDVVNAMWPALPAVQPVVGPREYRGTLLVRAGAAQYRHDAQGRVVFRRHTRLSRKPEIWRFSWDSDDQLTGVTTPDGQRWRYSYDPLGRRIAKHRLSVDGTTALEQVDFVWDGTSLAEQTIWNHEVANLRTTTWDHNGDHPIAQTERTEWRDAPQSWVNEQFYAIITDLVGAPSELVDDNGHVAWHAHRTLWGDTTWRSSGATTPLRFPGQYHDPESGLDYNYFRYYDPGTGRYTSLDPLGLAPDPNPNSYVDNPTKAADPLGLMSCDVEDGRRPWQITPEGTAETARHPKFGNFFKSESDGLWWSKDNADHGGSAWKVFRETDKGLRWVADADTYGDFIVGKHKGPTGLFVPWKELARR
ncbi:putative T7SS-secreted protein [Amycolatopsis mediterranei]|uniref:putative T7SS-secreted protein n=1 Tax=Amycolatopsis mediterranei TaxID=33910 RepID=UPI0034182525